MVASLIKKMGVPGVGGGGDDGNHVVMSWTNNLTYHCSGKATLQGIKHLHEARRNQFLHASIGVRMADKIMKSHGVLEIHH